jgi:hypothetical protein
MVPKDARENGAQIWEELEHQCAELFGRTYDEGYYTVVQALAYVALHYTPEADEYTGEGPCPTCGKP